jgi:hypothetical protein
MALLNSVSICVLGSRADSNICRTASIWTCFSILGFGVRRDYSPRLIDLRLPRAVDRVQFE